MPMIARTALRTVTSPALPSDLQPARPRVRAAFNARVRGVVVEPFWAVLLAATIAIAATPASSQAAGALSQRVAGAIGNAGLGNGVVAVSIRDCETGRELVSIRSDQSLIPASNMKLFTSGAALHVLRPDFSFHTRLLLAGDGNGGERLIVLADGDPAFGDPIVLARTSWTDGTGVTRNGMAPEELIDVWVSALTARGVRTLSEVVVDDRVFDRQFVHPSWPTDQLLQRSYGQVAGLNFHLNLLHLRPRPGQSGRPELASMQPAAPWLGLNVRASQRTGQKDTQSVWFSRPASSNNLTMHGNIRAAAQEPIMLPVHDMPSFFGDLLRDRLRRGGVDAKAVRVADLQEPVLTERSPNTTIVGPMIVTPITEPLRRCNADSQNLHAEALLKRTAHAFSGAPGSWDRGADAVRHAIHERVVRPLGDPSLLEGFRLADGSGLSRQNRVTARLVTAWLDSFHRDPSLGPFMLDSLAVAGETGTLRNRFRAIAGTEAQVQCKTGYISGVSCLSGYVTMPDGRRRSFAILGNNLTQAGAVAKARTLQERIVQLIVDDMAATTALGGD